MGVKNYAKIREKIRNGRLNPKREPTYLDAQHAWHSPERGELMRLIIETPNDQLEELKRRMEA